MENTKKLTGKDLINVGIYTAMTLVIFFVVGLLTALPVVYPFLFIIWPIVCGIPMMLYYTKIQKFGMLTITGIIGGIFFYLIGYGWIGLLGFVMRRFGFPVAPAVIGLILGPLAEAQFRRALSISQGDPSVFFVQPISATLLALTALLIVGPFVVRRIRGR